MIRDTYETVRLELSTNRQKLYALSGCGAEGTWSHSSLSSRNGKLSKIPDSTDLIFESPKTALTSD